MDPAEQFRAEVRGNIEALARDTDMRDLSRLWLRDTLKHRYTYNFSWLGRPIIQYPQDIVAMQELVWQVRPELIVETGIAHGGSLIMSASMLALLEYCDAAESRQVLDPARPRRKVLGIDIDIRLHNRRAIEAHPMADRIEMIQGSSVAPHVVARVRERAAGATPVLVYLDSNHTHEHVLAELEAYAGLVTPGSYCVVYDTVIEDMPAGSFPERPWGKGDNPKTAIREYLKMHPEFEVDKQIDYKLLISVAPDGYLRRR
jgi:cephalosporin hydroxylase